MIIFVWGCHNVKLGAHKIDAITKCAFLLGFYLEITKIQCMWCRKGCGHIRGSNGAAYDDSYCDKF